MAKRTPAEYGELAGTATEHSEPVRSMGVKRYTAPALLKTT